MTITVRPAYGWRSDGKSAAEIADDLGHTRHLVDADMHELQSTLTRSIRVASVVAALGVTVLTYLIHRIRHRR